MTADCSNQSITKNGCKPSQLGMLNSELMEPIDDPDHVVPMIRTLAFESHNITSATSSFIPLDARSNSNSSNDRESIFRDNENNSGWLSRTLCSLPSTPASEAIIDDLQEFESRADSETHHAESDAERQDTEDPYSFQVEIDEDGMTQIEVTRSVDDNCWSPTTPTESLSEDNFVRGPSLSLFDQKNDVIDALLLRNPFMCSGLDTWYNVDESEQTNILVQDEPEMPRINNRSSNLEGRKNRIERLKLNLTPFELDDAAIVKGAINSKRYSPVEIQKRVHSFSTFKPTSPTTVTISPTPSSRFECYNLPNCGNISVHNAALIDWDESYDEDLCYDSDPNELLVSSAMKVHSKENAASKQALNRVSDNQSLTVSSCLDILLSVH